MSATLQLPSRVQMANAAQVWQQLEAALRAEAAQIANAAGTELRLSAAALSEFDSSVLSVLLSSLRLTSEFGLRLTLREAPAKLHDLAKVYGVDELLWSVGTAATQAA